MDKTTAKLTARYNELKESGNLTPEVVRLIEDLLETLEMSDDLIAEILYAYNQSIDAHDRLLAIM